jgi:hypothetical protein
MARLSLKSKHDLNDLPTGWSSRQELLSHLCSIAVDTDISMQINLHRSKIFAGTSWQLSAIGRDMLGRLYKTYVIKHEANARVNGRVLMNIGRIINGPWHVNNTAMFVWDQSVYFELSMFDGDLHRFVDFRSPK